MVRLTPAQHDVVEGMRAGHRLVWFGDAGPELEGRPLWPQPRTVRALLRRGVLEWGEPVNDTQLECGIYPVKLTRGWQAADKESMR